MTDHEAAHPGDPRHPEHEAWLLELGRATFAAARVAGICFDLARILGGHPSEDMYTDQLGHLISRLKKMAARADQVPGLAEFIDDLEPARIDRNDLLHALPVAHGLYRRTDDLSYVRNFDEIEDLAQVTATLQAVAATGNRLLYQDDGAAIRRWYADQARKR
ncbi:MAG: hypothetical protein ACRCY9_17215 [Phycicoccus sp.]